MRRLLIIFALLGVVGTAGAFAGGALPGPRVGVSALYCALTGCTMTGQQVFSGVTTDITTGTNEDLTLAPNGTGVVNIVGGFKNGGNAAVVSNWSTTWGISAAGGTFRTGTAVLGQFKTGAASTVTDVMYGLFYTPTNGTGTATLDLTDTAGTAVCTMNFDCTAISTTAQFGSGSCSGALAANTVYQFRNKTPCTGLPNGQGTVTFKVTTP